MTKRLLSLTSLFALALIVFLPLLLVTEVSVWGESSSAAEDLQSQQESELTEQLWTLVRTIRRERSAYYKRQSERSDKIEKTNNISKSLESRLDELRKRDEELSEELAKIQSDINQLSRQTKKNESIRLSLAEQFNKFVTVESRNIETGIPYRRDDRLARLEGFNGAVKDQPVSDVFGRIWNFSQEEMRIAGSGETFTDEIDLGKDCRQNVRLFRVGHQILGYVTEDGDQAGIWLKQLEGGCWKHGLEDAEDEAVRKAVEILDRRRAPEYVSLATLIGPFNVTNQQASDNRYSE